MKKKSLPIMFLLVFVAPLFISALGSGTRNLLFGWLDFTLPVSAFLNGMLNSLYAYGIETLFCIFLLKRYATRNEESVGEQSFLLCLLMSFSMLVLDTAVTAALPNMHLLSTFFTNILQGIYLTIKHAFELIPNFHVTIPVAKVEYIPFHMEAPSLDEYKLQFLNVVIFAPLFEEFVSRYCTLRIIANRFGLAAGIVLSSISFAMMHKVGELSTNALIGGLIYGLIYVCSKYKLWVPILAHFLNNLQVMLIDTAKLVTKANLPIGFPTDTETAYRFAINTNFIISVISILATLILVAVYSKKAFSLWRGHSLAEQKPVAPTS